MAKALVVDDSRTIRTILRRLLVELGYEVCEAADGKQALAVIDAEGTAVSLVLTDWNMPEMDGLALLKRLRQNPDLSFAEDHHGHDGDRAGPHGDSPGRRRQ